jgi:hypothetical protein
MKKADNFDPSKWLTENKITTQSRLNKDESTKPLRIGSTITPDMWKPEQQVLGDWKVTPFFYKMKWTIVKIAKDYVTDEDDIKELVVSLDSKDYEDMIPLVDLNNALKKEYQIKK